MRVKLSVLLLAPLIAFPFKSPKSNGTFYVSLGDFTIDNRFVHGYEAYNTRGTSISLLTAHAILDRIEVQCSSVSVFVDSSCADALANQPMTRSDILTDFHFTLLLTRNLSRGHSHLFPDFKLCLSLEDEIKVFYPSSFVCYLMVSCYLVHSIGW